MSTPDEEPTVLDEVVDVFDKHGTAERREYSPLIPLENSAQYAESQGGKYIGHVAYSPDFNALIYQTRRTERGIIQKIDGRGIGVTSSVMDELQNQYGIEYVLVGKEESHNVFVIPASAFDKDVPKEMSRNFGSQVYANMREDISREITDAMGVMFSDPPNSCDTVITMEESQHLIDENN